MYCGYCYSTNEWSAVCSNKNQCGTDFHDFVHICYDITGQDYTERSSGGGSTITFTVNGTVSEASTVDCTFGADTQTASSVSGNQVTCTVPSKATAGGAITEVTIEADNIVMTSNLFSYYGILFVYFLIARLRTFIL